MLRAHQSSRNLTLLWGGQLISQAGSSISHIAVIWLMLELTGSSTLTGLVAFAGTAPALVFGLFAGVIVDQFNRQRVMLVGDGFRTLLVLLIPLAYFLGGLTPGLLAVLVFLLATFGTLFNPARDALIPEFIPAERLFNVNALVQSTGYLAYFAGLFGAGMIMGAVGLINLFFVDAMTFAFSFLMVALMRLPTRRPAIGGESTLKRHRTELKRGLTYIFREDRRLSWILIITALNNFFIMGPAIVGTPLLIREVWQGSGEDFAFIESTYGIGMLLGTLLVYRFASHYRKGTWLMLGLIYDGLTFIPLFWVASLGMSPFWATILIIFIHSIGIPFIQVTRTTLIHSIVPGKMQGRVFSMINLAVSGVTSLSVAVTGIAAEWLSAKTIFLIIGIGAALTGVIGLLNPSIRSAD